MPGNSVLVYDLHDLHLETDTGARLPGPLRSLLRRYEGRLVRDAAAVITVNEGLADYERRHFQAPRSSWCTTALQRGRLPSRLRR